MWYEWERREMPVWRWYGKMKERDTLRDLGLDGRIILKCVVRNRMGEGVLDSLSAGHG